MRLLCNNENTILLFGEDFFLLQDQGVGGWDGKYSSERSHCKSG